MRCGSASAARPGGLTPAEVAERHAPTARRAEKSRTVAVLGEVVESVVEPLQLLLIAVGVLSAIFGELRDAIAIFAIIGLVSTVEAVSEIRAKRALRALRDLSAPTALVRREGVVRAIAVDELVIGDVLLVEAGSVVAGDARVVVADGLAADESRLTGEPVAAAKGPEPVDPDAPLAERSSLLYAGSAVLAGVGEGVVVALGPDTEIGRLGRMVAEAREPPTPLQRAMAELARAALIVAVAASVLVPLLGVARGQPFREMLLDGLTLAFATIPEELPILVTVLVAIGGLRLARHGVLLRRLRAAEAVGAITVLLADKTGTLDREPARDRERRGRARARADRGGGRTRGSGRAGPGRPRAGRRRRWSRRRASAWPAIRSIPCASARARCGAIPAARGWPSRARPRPSSTPARCPRRSGRPCSRGSRSSRTTGCGSSRWPSAMWPVSRAIPRDAESELALVGLAAFRDPMRPGVADAVAELAHAGVRTIVVSGDHPKTVAAAAREAGVHGPEVLHGGAALAALDDDELAERLRGQAVIARATPEDKLRLVRVLQEQRRGRRRHRRRRQRRAGPRRGERRHRHGRSRDRSRP